MFDENDFDFDFSELESGFKYIPVDICGLVKKIKAKNKLVFNIGRETNQLKALIDKAPSKNECFKMISVCGGFSSIAIINYIAESEGIEQLYVSTFRIGRKHFQVLCKLHDRSQLKNVCLITSQQQVDIDTKSEYNYFNEIEDGCKERNWTIKSFANHSKLILMKTAKNYYVVETSSNLNENPKMEQFSWENDKALYEWYEELFKNFMAVE